MHEDRNDEPRWESDSPPPAENSTTPLDVPDASTPAHEPHELRPGDGSTGASGGAETDQRHMRPPTTDPVPSAPVASDAPARQSPEALPERFGSYPFKLARTRDGKPFAIFENNTINALGMDIGGEQFEGYLINLMYENQGEVNMPKLRDTIQQMAIFASHQGPVVDVWNRCAYIPGGCEIDLGDNVDTRVRVTARGVELLEQGSDTIFQKRPISQALPKPSDTPDWERLKSYLNLPPNQIYVLLAWITYSLCSPKTKGTKYVFLVVQGDQGTGKSFLCRLLQLLIDPSALDLQGFPANKRDLPSVLNGNHLSVFDNVRSFSAPISDLLCTASTGGIVSSRALYTNDSLHVNQLHGNIIFNGIHGFVVQSDLAQRCLTVRTKPIEGTARVAETDLLDDFESDLPDIFAGLLELASKTMDRLPDAEVTNPERMIEFCKWIAATELAMGLQQGTVQASYSYILNESQLDTLLDNSLASAVIRFISDYPKDSWSGTPAALLELLQDGQPPRALYAKDWPQNPIQLSKRLNALKASLETQGIRIDQSRGKQRQIQITNVGGLCVSEHY